MKGGGARRRFAGTAIKEKLPKYLARTYTTVRFSRASRPEAMSTTSRSCEPGAASQQRNLDLAVQTNLSARRIEPKGLAQCKLPEVRRHRFVIVSQPRQ